MHLIKRRSFLGHSALVFPAVHLPAATHFDVARRVHQYVSAQRFQGVVLAGIKDKLVYVEAFGIANFEGKVPMTASTRFEGGSISKWIASVVVLHQVDRGRLLLDAPISTYLPEFRRDNGSRLTLAHLMTHRSGVPNDIVAALRRDPALAEQELSQDEAVRQYASGDLQAQVGTTWDYSHSNWLLVKDVLEHAAGKPYEQLARELLWDPLRLRNSGIYHGLSIAIPGMAQSYRHVADGLPPLYPSVMPSFFTMAGGFYTTAPDLLHLMHAVVQGNVLSGKARALLFTTRVPETHYALGGRIRQRTLRGRQEEVVWEDGSNKGFRMLAVRVRRTGETVIIANNTSCNEQAMSDLADDILGIICI